MSQLHFVEERCLQHGLMKAMAWLGMHTEAGRSGTWVRQGALAEAAVVFYMA
jgi:hypothetical protein